MPNMWKRTLDYPYFFKYHKPLFVILVISLLLSLLLSSLLVLMRIIWAWFQTIKESVHYNADSNFVPSQWETPLHSNAVSQWLGATLDSALHHLPPWPSR